MPLPSVPAPQSQTSQTGRVGTVPPRPAWLNMGLALALFGVGCSGGETGGVPGSGGSGRGGTETGGATTGGTPVGGAIGSGGTGLGGTGGSLTGGHGGVSQGTGAAGRGGVDGAGVGGQAAGGNGGGPGASRGGGGGNSVGAYRCPSQGFPALQLPAATATRIAGAPPDDAFNNNGNGYTNVEGPVWIGNALYVSEIANSASRIIKIGGDDAVSIAVADAGSNGLAVDADGNLVSANQGAAGIVRFNLTTGAKTTLVDSYDGKRFNGPNDLTIRRDGGIFFTDPSFQSPSPQPVTGVYFLSAGTNVPKLSKALNNPNGITLSLDEKTIYVGDGSGLLSYPVSADGILGAGTVFGGITGSSDGMTIDCAGNLYVVRVDVRNVTVVDPTGKTVGAPITVPGGGQITNVAFGGADHKTLYITVMGTGTVRGVFKLANMPIPGMPY